MSHSHHAPGKTHARSDSALWNFLGPLRAFLSDPDVNEVCINRPGQLWTEGRGGWNFYEVPDLTFVYLEQLARLIASFNDKAINAQYPVLSAALPKGERGQIIIPPACSPDTVSITIRKPSLIDKTLEELDAEGAFTAVEEICPDLTPAELSLLEFKSKGQIKDFLDLAVKSHRNIIVVGPTGSGKTTIMKSMVRSIPAHERLITIEDVHELDLKQHKNKVHLFYARADEGGSRVTAKQALASCLRMKPDRILLAELRGDEAWDYVKAINTGHPGSITSMHANGALEAFSQLVSLIKDSPTGATLDTAYIKARLFATIDIVLYYSHRKLREIYYDPKFKREQD